jgi:hypothetical protein
VRTHLLKQQRTTPTLPLRTQGEDNQEKDIQNAKFRLTSHRRSPRCRCRPPRAAASSVFNKKKTQPNQTTAHLIHPNFTGRGRKEESKGETDLIEEAERSTGVHDGLERVRSAHSARRGGFCRNCEKIPRNREQGRAEPEGGVVSG